MSSDTNIGLGFALIADHALTESGEYSTDDASVEITELVSSRARRLRGRLVQISFRLVKIQMGHSRAAVIEGRSCLIMCVAYLRELCMFLGFGGGETKPCW